MYKTSLLLTAAAVLVASFTYTQNNANAAGANRVDPLLQQAIIETATPEPEIALEPEPIIEQPQAEIFEPLPVIADNNIEQEEPQITRALGLRAGGLLFLPQLIIQQGYDSNIFTTDGNEETDLITSLKPSIEITTPDSRHDLTIKGSYEYRKYWDNNDEDRNNIEASASGFLKGAEWLKIPFGVFWKNTHEEREDDLALQLSDNPLNIDDFRAHTGIEIKPGRLALGILGHYGKQRYENEFSTVNNAAVIRSDANRDELKGEAYSTLDLNENHMIKLSGAFGERSYERANFQGGAFSGPERDSKTYSGMAGWHFAFTGLKGHLAVGYKDRDYTSAAIQDMGEIIVNGKIIHDISDTTSFNLGFERDIYEDEEILNPIMRSTLSVFFDHKFRENMLLAAGAEYGLYEFQNLNRNDDRWKFRALADYFLTENLALGLEFVHSLRDSDAAGLSYDRNQIMLRARGRI